MFILEQAGQYTLMVFGTKESGKKVYVAFSKAVPVAFVEKHSEKPGTAFRLPEISIDRFGNKHAVRFLDNATEMGWYDISYVTGTVYEFDKRLEEALRQIEWDHRYTAGSPESEDRAYHWRNS